MWNVEGTFQKAKNQFVIKQMAEAKIGGSIAERMNRCLDDRNRLECKDFWKNPLKRRRRSDCGGLNLFSTRHVNWLN